MTRTRWMIVRYFRLTVLGPMRILSANAGGVGSVALFHTSRVSQLRPAFHGDDDATLLYIAGR